MSCNQPLIYIPGSIACSISVFTIATWWSIGTAARIILEIDNSKKWKHYKKIVISRMKSLIYLRIVQITSDSKVSSVYANFSTYMPVSKYARYLSCLCLLAYANFLAWFSMALALAMNPYYCSHTFFFSIRLWYFCLQCSK